MLARGSALLGFDAAPKIWDLAAIWLLVQEAGGVIASFEAPSPFPISPNNDFSIINYPTLAAATLDVYKLGQRSIHKKMKTTLESKSDD
jgi:myo-inositol-1(or 4)-monophosphatase